MDIDIDLMNAFDVVTTIIGLALAYDNFKK